MSYSVAPVINGLWLILGNLLFNHDWTQDHRGCRTNLATLRIIGQCYIDDDYIEIELKVAHLDAVLDGSLK